MLSWNVSLATHSRPGGSNPLLSGREPQPETWRRWLSSRPLGTRLRNAPVCPMQPTESHHLQRAEKQFWGLQTWQSPTGCTLRRVGRVQEFLKVLLPSLDNIPSQGEEVFSPAEHNLSQGLLCPHESSNGLPELPWGQPKVLLHSLHQKSTCGRNITFYGLIISCNKLLVMVNLGE